MMNILWVYLLSKNTANNLYFTSVLFNMIALRDRCDLSPFLFISISWLILLSIIVLWTIVLCSYIYFNTLYLFQ